MKAAGIMPATKKAALYVRVSTGRQAEEGTSLESQEEACRGYAAAHGYEVDEAHVYREIHTGVELWERPRLTRMREAVRAREVEAVIVYAIDRLARDPVHLGVIISEADHQQVAVSFVTEPLDSSPEGELIRFVRGYAAKVEHEKIRERFMRGKRARVAAGKLLNLAVDMYGYRRDKEAGVRRIYEPEARIVRWLFEQVALGMPLQRLTNQLQRDGVPTAAVGKITFKDGRIPSWSRSTVARMLRNPAYKGETYAFRWRKEKLPESETSRLRPFEEWTRLPEGVTPALVSPALWEAAQARLDQNRGEMTRNEKRPYLLRGLLFCPVCGRRMVVFMEKGKHRCYRCSSWQSPSGPCGGRRLRAEVIEPLVWNRVSQVLRDPSLIAAELRRREAEGQGDSLAADRLYLERLEARLEKQQERLLRRYREAEDDQSFPWEMVQREIALAEAEKTQARRAIVDLDQRRAAARRALQQLDSLAAYCARVAQNLDSFGFADQRLALEALSIRVIAQGSGVRNGPPVWRLEGSIPLEAPGNEEGVQTPICSNRQQKYVFRFSLAA